MNSKRYANETFPPKRACILPNSGFSPQKESIIGTAAYTRRDCEFVEKLSHDLREAGIRFWRDTEQIHPGQQWQRAIEDALDDAVALLYVSSKHSRRSGWVEAELSANLLANKLVIPIIIDNVGETELPIPLRHIQWVDFRQPYDITLNKLLSAFPEFVKTFSTLASVRQRSKGYVFISYTEEDSDFVETLREFLGTREYGYWDFTENDRNYHTQFFRELEGVINEAAATLSILSEAWKDSTWAMRELFFSEEVGTPIFLLRAKKIGPSLAIAGTLFIDFVSDAKTGFKKLERELKRKGL